MATVTGMTAAAMQAIRDATVVDASYDSVGNLILEKYDATTVDVGVYPDATSALKGIVELATNTEIDTGTDAVRVVTPAGLAHALSTLQHVDADLAAIAALSPADDDFIQRKSGVWVNRTLTQVATDLIATGSAAASDTQKGFVELATSAETATGTDATRAVTPAGLASLLSKLPKAMEHGTVTITPVANTVTSLAVTFTAGRFSTTPKIQVTARTTVPGSQVLEVAYSGASTTGCTIYMYRTNTTDTIIDWLATEF